MPARDQVHPGWWADALSKVCRVRVTTVTAAKPAAPRLLNAHRHTLCVCEGWPWSPMPTSVVCGAASGPAAQATLSSWSF